MKNVYTVLFISMLFLTVNFLSAQATLDFEDLTVGTNWYVDTGDPLVVHALENNDLPQTQPIIEATASTLGIEIEFTPTRSGGSDVGLTDGDLFGAVDVTIPASADNNMGSFSIDYNASPPSNGNKIYTLEDPDGLVTVTFTEVDLTGTTTPSFSMDYIFSDASYEASNGSTDQVRIYLLVDGSTEIDLLNVETDAVPNDETWRTLTQDLTAHIGSTVQLIIEMDTDAATEEMAIDNISFSQGAVVLPCVAPVINGVTLVDCGNGVSGNVTLAVDGELNGATTWQWANLNENNLPCDQVPTVTTGPQITANYFDYIDETFYVRAVGGCVEEPVCFAFVPSQLTGQPATISLSTTTYCEDAGVQTGLTGGSPAGGVYSGPGVTDDGNGMTFTFDPATAGLGNHQITYTRNTDTACGESTASTTVTVAALPSVTFTAPGPFTVDDGIQALSGGMPAGGTYSGPGVTDNNFDPAAAGVGTHAITYTYTDGNGCMASASGEVTVEANCEAPVINGIEVVGCPLSPALMLLRINGVLNGADQWEWSSAVTAGGPCTSGFTTFVGQEITAGFPSSVDQASTYLVRAVGGCLTEPVCISYVPNDLFATVLPAATFTPDNTTYCETDGLQIEQGGGTPTGGTYSGLGVTDDGNGMTFTFDPATAGEGFQIITYTVVDATCSSGGVTATIEVLASPDVTFTAPGPFMTTDGVQALSGGMPEGGTYSGPGVTDNNFDPAVAGVGTHSITYSYTDANGCMASANGDITVEMMQAPDNACGGANDISSLFGQTPNEPQTSTLYDNTGYNSTDDPITGYDCFDDGTLERTTWYSFTGDGNNYRIKTVACNATNYLTNGDTQIAIYSGDCVNPVAVACNEDEDFANEIYNANVELMTEEGVTYLVMIDGWTGTNYSAEGEFCIEVTNLTPSGVISIDQTDIGVFPNPTSGILHFSSVEVESVEVFNSAGQHVLSKINPGTSIDMAQLPAGVYFVKLFAGEDVISARVVKE